MTKDQKIIRAKVGVLELAKQLGNVSQACKMMGYSRDSFYRFKELYDKGGELALQELSRRKPILKNRVAPEVEEAVVALAIEQPAWGQVRVSNELLKRGVTVSPFGVRCDLAAPRPGDDEAPAEGARGQDGAGAPDPDRKPARRAGEGQGRQGGARRVRERVPGLLRGAGHLLCRHAEGRRPGLPADLHRHLRQGRLRQAVRPQDADHRRRPAQRPGDPVLRRARRRRCSGC